MDNEYGIPMKTEFRATLTGLVSLVVHDIKTCDNCFEIKPLKKVLFSKDMFCADCIADIKVFKKERQQERQVIDLAKGTKKPTKGGKKMPC